MTTEKCTDVDKMQGALYDVDMLTSNCFAEIIATVKLILSHMETPQAYLHPDTIARALHSIWLRAEETSNSVSYDIEALGCSHERDDGRMWRAREEAVRILNERVAARNAPSK